MLRSPDAGKNPEKSTEQTSPGEDEEAEGEAQARETRGQRRRDKDKDKAGLRKKRPAPSPDGAEVKTRRVDAPDKDTMPIIGSQKGDTRITDLHDLITRVHADIMASNGELRKDINKQREEANKRQDKMEAKMTAIDDRVTAIDKRVAAIEKNIDPPNEARPHLQSQEEHPRPYLHPQDLPLEHQRPPVRRDELCYRQLLMGPVAVGDNGRAALSELVFKVLYEVMGFPNREPFLVQVEGASGARRVNGQISNEMYAKVTFIDAQIRKQVLLSQAKLGQAGLDVDIRIIVPPHMRRRERTIDKILYFIRTASKSVTDRKCQTNKDIDEELGMVGMYRWKKGENQPAGAWQYVQPFEDMTKPALDQFVNFLGKAPEHLEAEWKNLIVTGFNQDTGRIR